MHLTKISWKKTLVAFALCLLAVPAFAQAPPTTPAYPVGTPLEISSNIYGTTMVGGTAGWGTVWRYNKTTGVYTTTHSFDGAHGATPMGKLIKGADGYLYGTTVAGGGYATIPPAPIPGGYGTIWRMLPNGTNFSIVYVLQNVTTQDGSQPNMGLIEDPKLDASGRHVFYGVTPNGGPNSTGTVFELAVDASGVGTYSKLFAFDPQVFNVPLNIDTNATGAYPRCELLLQTLTGTNTRYLFGTTTQGGATGGGTVFSLNWTGATIPAPPSYLAETIIKAFPYSNSGVPYGPYAGLIMPVKGNSNTLGAMYGTTAGLGGGTGAIYQIFGGTYGMEYPISGADSLYLARTYGGTPLGTGQVANVPTCALCYFAGNFYGTSLVGGHMTGSPPHSMGSGTIFQLAAGVYDTLQFFTPESNIPFSEWPLSGLYHSSDGFFYGVASSTDLNGSHSTTNGCLFKMDLTGAGPAFTVLHSY